MQLRKKLAATATATVTLSAAGIAFAAWTADIDGTGGASAGSHQATTVLAVTPTAPEAQLYPGGTGDVKFTVKNPNPYPVRYTSVALNGAITSDKGLACNTSTGVTYTAPTGPWDVPAHSEGTTFTLTGAVSMSNASDNSCQGATFTIPLKLTGTSNA